MASTDQKAPDLQAGIDYWTKTPATVDGVLGGFGTGTLPRVDALGSRQFAQSLLPYLAKVPSPLRPLDPTALQPSHRIRALDVGAGIGRVTSTVLLHLVDDVVIVEPIAKFVDEAVRLAGVANWKGIKSGEKSVTFLTGPLQRFDPTKTVEEQGYDFRPQRLGASESEGHERGYDVVWCQWALGHLSDADLVSFFKNAKASLRKSPTGRPQEDGLIIVKENVCSEGLGGKAAEEFDDDDSSVTRSNLKWREIFQAAGLKLVRDKIQLGLPEGLYQVRMYALR